MTQRNGSPRFMELLEVMGDIHQRKNADYSPGADPWRNFRRSERVHVPAFVGAWNRLGDKIERSETLIANVMDGKGENAAVKDESLWDTLIDGANYFLIVACLYEEYLEAHTPHPYVEQDDVDDDMTVFERIAAMRQPKIVNNALDARTKSAQELPEEQIEV
jgi:hypothetical protein